MLEHTVAAIHGNERVEGVTIARVDKGWNPIAGTERRVDCDTLLISAGLIPENELSRMAGIELDTVTGGPVVNSDLESSVPGIFIGGNVLHVNDLVDNVTLEAELAGASAASYAKGKVKCGEKGKVHFKAGENVRYIVPQKASVGDDVTLSLRVKEPAEKVRLKIGNIYSKAMRVVKPSQMVRVSITAKDWQGSNKASELVVSCESRR
jgi:pyruvate/2-oxoglutarate dehydrogenase complex dihydrolipoamide dehydrogenase (E3) component